MAIELRRRAASDRLAIGSCCRSASALKPSAGAMRAREDNRLIGTSIASFRITAKLGEGGMGEVYRATDTKLKRDVAIKVLPPGAMAFTLQ